MSYRNEPVVKVIGTIGFLDILTLIFAVLKLKNIIDWSWWWVTAPFWGQFVLAIIFMIVLLVVYIIAKLIGIKKRFRRVK